MFSAIPTTPQMNWPQFPTTATSWYTSYGCLPSPTVLAEIPSQISCLYSAPCLRIFCRKKAIGDTRLYVLAPIWQSPLLPQTSLWTSGSLRLQGMLVNLTWKTWHDLALAHLFLSGFLALAIEIVWVPKSEKEFIRKVSLIEPGWFRGNVMLFRTP